MAAAAATGSPFRYSREGGEITIWSYEGNERVVRVPETLEGLPVTRLDAWTFLVWSGASVLELHLPATLASLGETPLIGMDALQSIFVSPDNPHFHSREGVLFNRDQTTLVKYPTGRAGPYVVPDGVRAIGDHAFAYAGGLGEVVLPDSVEHLGEGAFYSCQGLRAVTLPDRLSGEALQAFQDSGPLDEQAGLRWLVLNRSALLTGFPSPPIEPRGWAVPETLEGWPLRFIGAFAFSGSWNLTRVEIHAQMVGIGEGAFARVRGLQAFEVAEANPAFASVEGVLFNKDRTTLLQFPAGRGGDYAIPAGVTALAPGSFLGCTALRRVEMPDSVTTLGAGAFAGCEALEEVSLSSRLTAIAPEAFATCWGLRRIVLPDSVSEVGQRAFYQAGLETVVLGRGVTWVGEGAFDNRYSVCRGGGGSVCYGPRDYYGARVDLFFLGRAPQADRPFGDRPVVWGRDYSEPPQVFHLAEAAGWGPAFEGVPTELWRGIHLLRGADGLTLIWPGGVLQASPGLGTGSEGAGWSDVPATAPLHLVRPTAAATFYRLRDP